MESRALLLGINNYKTISDLRGCVNDVENIESILVEVYDFDVANIIKLTDSDVTRSRVLAEFDALVDASEPGDRLVIHFSGHGSHKQSDDNDEPVDELICLYDMAWSRPDSYLTDDEIGDLLKKIPQGVRTTVIFDCCHSGSGTREVSPSGARSTRSSPYNYLEIAEEPESEQHKSRVRFCKPRGRNNIPTAEQLAVHTANFRKLTRTAEQMNHLFFAGAADTELAADAFIDGNYQGAFSYFFCDAIRQSDSEIAADIFKLASANLLSSGYSQTPQIEGSGQSDPLFASVADTLPADNILKHQPSGTANALWQHLQHAGQEFFNSYETHRGNAPVWVAVHGISAHAEGYSDEWFAALEPHISIDLARAEVRWSQHVNKSRSSQDTVEESEMESQLRAEIEAVIEDRSDTSDIPATRGGGFALDDFLRYMISKTTREKIIAEFTGVVLPLLEAGNSLHIVSHSWGTVVAYEGLRRLERESTAGRVQHLFTVGSALSIGTVRRDLFSRVNDGRKPGNVDQWINLDARSDWVGGSIRKHFAVDKEHLKLDPTNCSGFPCAHSSYFDADNTVVNKDIFATAIQSTSASRGSLTSDTIQNGVAEDQLSALQEFIDDLLDSTGSISSRDVIQPRDTSRIGSNKLALVVGHTRRRPGALSVSPMSSTEYSWNSDLAKRIEAAATHTDIEVRIFYRDNIGIAGAYRQLASWGASSAVELHFNAYNGRVAGTETLYGTACAQSKQWAEIVQNKMVDLYQRTGRTNRGLKACPPYNRGARSVNALSHIPTCLIEPVFGDNSAEARLAEQLKDNLARELLAAFIAYQATHTTTGC